MALRRVAYCSPVNPVSSGIADYSEELLPFLGQYVELELFVERGVVPSNPQLSAALTVHTVDTLVARHRRQPYDAIIYHLGNSPAHTAIYEALLALPGMVVLHDWVLHHFKLGRWAQRNELQQYRDELARDYGAAGRRTADRMLRGQLTDAVFQMPLNRDVLVAARGLIGHSQWLVTAAHSVAPALPTAHVPMGVPLPPAVDQAAARAALGLDQAAVIWASFGHINPYKRIEPALRAFRRFASEVPGAQYILVGSVSPSYPLDAIIARLGLSGAVTVTGYVSADSFAAYVAAADLCLNLRHPTAGETSASLLRLLGAGRPTLVSAGDAFAELPDAVCAKVDADASEADLIYGYALLLHRRPAVAAALGAAARHWVAEQHTLAQAARGYAEFLAQLYGWEPPAIARPPLWTLPSTELPALAPHPTVVAAPAEAVPGLGQALAELGVRAEDTAALSAVAAVAADLLG